MEKTVSWRWFTEKVLPSLFVTMTLTVIGGAWAIYRTIDDLSDALQSQQKDITLLQVSVKELQANSVTRSELLETMKRVEQQLEIMMLRAKIK
jgi:hypothetical protein